MRPGFSALQGFIVFLSSFFLSFSFADASESSRVPTFRDVVGHDFGERITLHHEMMAFVERLKATSPRVLVQGQGRSWEGRELPLVVISSPENLARIAQIRDVASLLADPRGKSEQDLRDLIDGQPAVVWLGGSIHGFELSGTEGVLRLLETLTREEGDEIEGILSDVVVLIDPMLNPDGRDAFARRNHENLGRIPSSSRDSWENDYSRWEAIKFRTGHYYFDTNRDWFAHTQPETRQRVATWQSYHPQVIVDAHEMGSDAEFYFDPPGGPYPTFFPEYARRWFRHFGRAYARAFDRAGYEYMTGERYNYYYPGYTTSYGSYQGAVGMLFEQGSSRGLLLERADGSSRSLRDALDQQYLACLTAVKTAARERGALLSEYVRQHQKAIQDGQSGTRRYLLMREGDRNLIEEMADLLTRGGVEVFETTAPIRLGSVKDRSGSMQGEMSFPPGTYVVEAAQPRNLLIRTLLEPSLAVPESFLSEAKTRVDRDERARFYDITAWSLPLLFDLRAYSTSDSRKIEMRRRQARGETSSTLADGDPSPYAYFLDGRDVASLAALHSLRRSGFRAAFLRRKTRIEGKDVASGSVILRVGQNDARLATAVEEARRHFGLRVMALGSGLAESGFPSLGSGDVIPIRPAEIALLSEHPVQGYSFGWTWFVLDQQYEIPVTVLRSQHLPKTRLSRFQVLIIPSLESRKDLAALLGVEGMKKIEAWVRQGGTLVTLGSAVDFAREDLSLLSLSSWYESTEERSKAYRFNVPGAILRGRVHQEEWLGAGFGTELPLLVNSDRIYLPPSGPADRKKRVVVRYAASKLILSGHVWPDSIDRLRGAVFAYEERVGDGRIIALAEDVSFRGYYRGTDRLLLNAIVVGPSAP